MQPSDGAGLLLSQPLINSSLRPLIWPLGLAERHGFCGCLLVNTNDRGGGGTGGAGGRKVNWQGRG